MAQCEVLEGEAQRCRQRLEQLETERQDLQDALNTERDRVQVRPAGRPEHRERPGPGETCRMVLTG